MASRGCTLPLMVYMRCGVGGLGLNDRYFRNGRLTAPTLVLLYVAENGVQVLSPMQVRAWLREQFNIDLDRRRLWDAFKKLESMGIFRKIRRGWYRVVNLARALAELAKRLGGSEDRVSGCTLAATGQRRGGGSGLVWDGGCVVVFRDHRRVGRGDEPVGLVEEGLVRAGFLWRMYQLVERAYEGLLLGLAILAIGFAS